MHPIDWIVFLLFIAYTLWDGLRHANKTQSLSDLLLAKRQVSWWAAGLSVMATQASAITFIGTTGLAFMEDMRFLQVYLGLPIAMIILSVTLVPFFYRANVFTAYELLEARFGLGMRLLTSGVFLLSRGVTLGATIAAPAYVLALILDMPLSSTIWLIGLVATIYTMFGGVAGVIRTDMKQMILMLGGLVFCFAWLVWHLGEHVSLDQSLHVAGTLGKLRTIDLSFDPSEKYNLWSGMLAGVFLMLSYFGTDQSQVQRFLTVKSVADARISLLMSAIFKVPMQFFILLLGVLLFVFYTFEDRPLLFVPEDNDKLPAEIQAAYEDLRVQQKESAMACASQDPAACQALSEQQETLNQLRRQGLDALADEKGRDDTNYVFTYFILERLPKGVIGLLVAAILAAALSSIDSMLNALAATTVIDWLKRLDRGRERNDLRATRVTTAIWGLFGTLAGLAFGETESIVELVNRLGSYFYGPVLGLFALFWLPHTSRAAAMWGFALSLGVVLALGGLHIGEADGSYHWIFPLTESPHHLKPALSYLWLNPIGVGVILLIGTISHLQQRNHHS